jgi:NAD(P)-dependent dehydrogenase (short-subunit alcohol dehydrogenase family)
LTAHVSLRGQVALVTGGGSGIGRATSVMLAAEGARVAVLDREEGGAAATAALIEGKGGEALAIAADVSSASDVASALHTVAAVCGALHILVNNAGVDDVVARVEELEEAAVDRVLAINLKGQFLVAGRAVPLMIRSAGKAIVNTSSIAALIGAPGKSLYSSTKGAIVSMTRALALDLAPQGIRVNAVCPGAIERTAMHDAFFATQPDPDRVEAEVAERIPLGRFGTPEDVARAILFLASDDAAYITGTTLVVDGGWTTP